jgi:hypothetical protein
MSTRAKIIYLSLAVLFLFVTLGCIYYLMGGIIPGVNDLRVYALDGKSRSVVGMPYEGEPESKEAGELFLRYRDWISNDRKSATITQEIMRADELDDSKLQFNFLSVINYPTGDKKKVKQFIGVAMRGSSGQLPIGEEEVIEVSCDRRYTVFLPMNLFLRPPTARVEKMIREEAARNNDKIDFFYEIYYPDNSLQVEGFVVD